MSTTRRRLSATDLDLRRDSANETRVQIGPITLFFSYSTVVAFMSPKLGLVVSENVWSTTTGRHLNNIDGGDKGRRVDSIEFERLLAETIDRLHLAYEG